MIAIDKQLARLVSNFRKSIDDDVAEEYHAALGNVPLPVLTAAVSRAIQTRRFLPNVCELLEDVACVSPERPPSAEFEPCDECRDHIPGWRSRITFYRVLVKPASGRDYYPAKEELVRCQCWIDYQARRAPAADPRKVAHFRARGESDRRAG
jgi:hypothetical protein